MKGMVNYASPNQIPIAIGDSSGAKAIAHWLGNDLQYSMASVERWLAVFADISKGTRTEGYQGTGNAFSVSATRQIVLLQSEYVDSHMVCLTVDQIARTLQHYRMFLASDYRSSGFQPLPFEVEYLAEEDAALEYYLENGGVLG